MWSDISLWFWFMWLMINDFEHLFMYLLGMCMSLEKYLFKIFCPFFKLNCYFPIEVYEVFLFWILTVYQIQTYFILLCFTGIMFFFFSFFLSFFFFLLIEVQGQEKTNIWFNQARKNKWIPPSSTFCWIPASMDWMTMSTQVGEDSVLYWVHQFRC